MIERRPVGLLVALGAAALVLSVAAATEGATRELKVTPEIERAVTRGLDYLARTQQADGSWREHLRPIEVALGHLPRVTVDADTARRLANGQGVSLDTPATAQLCAYDQEHRLVAILRPDDVLWRPHKVFASEAYSQAGQA